jgi:hypothetical protein
MTFAQNNVWDRIHNAADAKVPAVRDAFLDVVAEFKASIDLKELAVAILQGRVPQVLDQEAFAKALSATIGPKLFEIAQEIGLGTVDLLPGSIRRSSEAFDETFQGYFARTSFDIRLWDAEEFIRSRFYRGMEGIGASSQAAVQKALLDGFQQGLHPDDIARRMRDAIGLTSSQYDQAQRYGHGLIVGGMDVTRALNLEEEYLQRLTNQRATTIARTETLRAANAGQVMAWETAAANGLLDPAETRETWIVTPDDRLCSYCVEMEGKTAPLSSTPGNHAPSMSSPGFFSPEMSTVVQHPPLHSTCRCTVGLEFGPPTPDSPPQPSDDWRSDWDQAAEIRDEDHANRWGDRWSGSSTPTEQGALRDYSGNAYEPINGKLRTGYHSSSWGDDQLDEMISGVTSIIDRHALSQAMRLFRSSSWKIFSDLGIMKYDVAALKRAIGSVVQDKGFFSTSAMRERTFSKDLLLEIYAPKGTKGVYLNAIKDTWGSGASQFPGELEVLLQKGTRFQILEVIEEPSQHGGRGRVTVKIRIVP